MQRLDGTPCWTKAFPGADEPLDRAALLALDLEMTGLDPEHDEIVSIGWVPVDEGRIRPGAGRHVLVRSEDDAHAGVGSSAGIHGIRDCDRGPGRALATALHQLFDALDGRVPVVHHAPLDHAFLDRACRLCWGTGWTTPIVDTLDVERRLRLRADPEAGPGTLQLNAVRERYGLPPRKGHDALSDALSCAELALAQAARNRSPLLDRCRLMRRR